MTIRPVFLYRYYDESDVLLYVGISTTPESRDRYHSAYSRWHKIAARFEVDPIAHADVATAKEAERACILAHSPIFNAVHQTDSGFARARIYAAQRGIAPPQNNGLCERPIGLPRSRPRAMPDRIQAPHPAAIGYKVRALGGGTRWKIQLVLAGGRLGPWLCIDSWASERDVYAAAHALARVGVRMPEDLHELCAGTYPFGT